MYTVGKNHQINTTLTSWRSERTTRMVEAQLGIQQLHMQTT